MGRPKYSTRHTVEQCLHLSISQLKWKGVLEMPPEPKAYGVLEWHNLTGDELASLRLSLTKRHPGGLAIRLRYAAVDKATGETENLDYIVLLTTTRCHFGGVRYWFVCPLAVNGKHCGRRVGKLYAPPGARYFGCRVCHNLTYTSCRESHKYDGFLRFIEKEMGIHPRMVKGQLGHFWRDRLSLALLQAEAEDDI